MATLTIDQALQVAVEHYLSGRLAEAEGLFRQILELVPDHADALHLMGVLACTNSQWDSAISLIGRAVEVRPEVAEYHQNLGESYRRAERKDEAIACFRRAIERKFNYAESYNSLGLALSESGRIDEAIDAYRGAIEHDAGHVWAHANLGHALTQLGRHDEAIAAYTRSVTLDPSFTVGHRNLALVWEALGRLDEAIAAYRRVIALQPDDAWALLNLANSLGATGAVDEAISLCRRTLELTPACAHTQNSMGAFLHAKGELDEAMAAYRRAVELKPDFGGALGNLATTLKDVGRIDESLAAIARAIEVDPGCARDDSNRLMTLHFHPESDGQSLLAEHRGWARRHAEPLASEIRSHSNDRTPDRTLRVGFVSPDLRSHPVGQLLGSLFAHRDRTQFEYVAYSNSRTSDSVSEKLKGLVDRWCDVADLSDPQLADRIRADQIDILVDLALHTAANRLLVFARKPAPVQVTMLGMVSTTGLATIDYRLTDPFLDPPGESDGDYTEHSVRLPHSFWCYEPILDAPPVGPLPALRNGFVSFGCLNQFAKMSRPALELWVTILQAVENSRLVLYAAPGNHREALRERLRRAGIAPERLAFVERVFPSEYLARYHDVDLALDPFPFNGGATTMDALWMGVPVITLAGRTAVGRGGVSILTNLGLPELIARTPERYREIAVATAADVGRMARLRAGLRDRMKGSTLMDGQRYAAEVEGALRQMWKRWCGSTR